MLNALLLVIIVFTAISIFVESQTVMTVTPADIHLDDVDLPRALIIGDSFLDSWSMKHYLRRDLGQYFKDHGFHPVVISRAGSGVTFYSDAMSRFSLKLCPDVVLVFYHAGNDVSDTMRETNERLAGDRCRCKIEHVSKRRFDWAMFKACGVDPSMIDAAKRRLEDPDVLGGQRVNPFLLCAAVEFPGLYRANLLIDTPAARRAWEKNVVLLREGLRSIRRRRSKVFLVAIPAALQVNAIHGDFLRKVSFQISDELARSTVPQDRLRDFCKKEDVTFVDLLPDFRRANNRRALYFETDDHFTEAGHRLAMEILKKKAPWTPGCGPGRAGTGARPEKSEWLLQRRQRGWIGGRM